MTKTEFLQSMTPKVPEPEITEIAPIAKEIERFAERVVPDRAYCASVMREVYSVLLKNLDKKPLRKYEENV